MEKNLFYIPFEKYKIIGGPSTFMRNLKDYLDKEKISYLNNPKNADVILFSAVHNFKVIEKVKKSGGFAIQRLDGVFYPEKHGQEYISLNSEIKDIYLKYSDFIVFQSEYSKNQCFKMFGEKPPEKYTIIHNGVNKKIFYPKTDKDNQINKRKIQFITTGSFRNIEMLEPIIWALDKLKGKLDFELNIAGPITNNKLVQYFDRSYLTYHGNLGLNHVADLLRSSDIFLYSILNPSCPNSVLEAISCAIPIVGFASGSMSELLYFSRDLLADVSDDIFQKYSDYDFNKIVEKIILAVEKYGEISTVAQKNASLYSFEECGKKYWEVIKNFLSRK